MLFLITPSFNELTLIRFNRLILVAKALLFLKRHAQTNLIIFFVLHTEERGEVEEEVTSQEGASCCIRIVYPMSSLQNEGRVTTSQGVNHEEEKIAGRKGGVLSSPNMATTRNIHFNYGSYRP